MKLFATLVLTTICFYAKAQDVKLFAERTDQGFSIYATNGELCPASLSLNLEMTNLSFSEGSQKIFVIPPAAAKHKIGDINVINRTEKTKYSYKYQFVLGDVTKKDYNKDYVYDLPFQKGKAFNVYQGYKGGFSHQNENAVDFTMPEGTEILAAREGLVVTVVQQNTESCLKEECKKYNNYVLIYHADGTFASYVHLKYNGSKVKVGDVVKKGDVIALSGNTGWSTGPHLHFVTFLPEIEKRNTLETKFRIGNGNKAAYLQERETYTREY
jgi:hypothetical protein